MPDLSPEQPTTRSFDDVSLTVGMAVFGMPNIGLLVDPTLRTADPERFDRLTDALAAIAITGGEIIIGVPPQYSEVSTRGAELRTVYLNPDLCEYCQVDDEEEPVALIKEEHFTKVWGSAGTSAHRNLIRGAALQKHSFLNEYIARDDSGDIIGFKALDFNEMMGREKELLEIHRIASHSINHMKLLAERLREARPETTT